MRIGSTSTSACFAYHPRAATQAQMIATALAYSLTALKNALGTFGFVPSATTATHTCFSVGALDLTFLSGGSVIIVAYSVDGMRQIVVPEVVVTGTTVHLCYLLPVSHSADPVTFGFIEASPDAVIATIKPVYRTQPNTCALPATQFTFALPASEAPKVSLKFFLRVYDLGKNLLLEVDLSMVSANHFVVIMPANSVIPPGFFSVHSANDHTSASAQATYFTLSASYPASPQRSCLES